MTGKTQTPRRIPKLYREAGRILQKVKEDGGSVKTLVYEARHPNLKALYALVLETLKHGQQLDYLVRKTQILVENPRLSPWLTRVLMTELLWQKKALSAASPPQEIVNSYHEKFLSELANVPSDEASRDTPNSSTAAQAVRYVRVNILKDTTENVVKWFTNIGWEEVTQGSSKSDFLKKLGHLTSCQFIRDFDLPDLLVFPHDFRFYETDLYADGAILLQDKASCTPPILLTPLPGSVVLDMCAAPGMKTTQIAALIGNKGTVYAVEINDRRYDSLCKTVEKAGATSVKAIKGDVLHQSNLQNVQFIILDPPCSGSGMLSRKSIFGDEQVDSHRLTKLANFQCSLLRHAMTSFPKVKRIVYSTCSVYPEENEAVIDSVLRSVPPNFVAVRNPPHTAWMTRGSPDYEHGSCGFYAYPDTHRTNGFFVAVFERSDREYESLSKPSKVVGDASNDESSEKKKKRKRKDRTQQEVSGNDDAESRVKKAEQTDSAVQMMLKAMQKMSKPQSTSSEIVEDSVDYEGDSGELKKSKKKKEKSKQKRGEIFGDSADYEGDSGEVKKSKKKKDKSKQNGEESEDDVKRRKRCTASHDVKEENSSHVEQESDVSTISHKKRKKTLVE